MFIRSLRLRFAVEPSGGDGGGDGGGTGGDGEGGGTPPPSTPPAPKPGEEPLGEKGIKALQAERDAHAAAEKRAADLQKQLDAIEAEKLSDLQRAQKAADDAVARAEAAEAKVAAAELDSLRRDVAAEKNLPAAVASRLAGSTREEIEADADELAKVFAGGAGPRDTPDPFTGFRSSTKTSGRQAGLDEAARRFGTDKT